jgi:hypothetical protein
VQPEEDDLGAPIDRDLMEESDPDFNPSEASDGTDTDSDQSVLSELEVGEGVNNDDPRAVEIVAAAPAEDELKESDVDVDAAAAAAASGLAPIPDAVVERNKGGRPALEIYDLNDPIGAVSKHKVGEAMKMLFDVASKTRMNVTQTEALFQSCKNLCENGENKIPHHYHAKKIAQKHNPLTIVRFAACPVNDCELIKLSEHDKENRTNIKLINCSKCHTPLRDKKGRIKKVSLIHSSAHNRHCKLQPLTDCVL